MYMYAHTHMQTHTCRHMHAADRQARIQEEDTKWVDLFLSFECFLTFCFVAYIQGGVSVGWGWGRLGLLVIKVGLVPLNRWGHLEALLGTSEHANM